MSHHWIRAGPPRAKFVSVIAGCFLVAACSPSAPDTRAPRGEPGDRTSAVAPIGSGTARAVPQVPADAPLVAFLGDSISAGLHLSASEAYPAVLQADLARAGHPFRLLNAGVSGDTSAGGLARVDWILQQKPAILVIELGGNDGLRGQDLAAIERNLRDLVARARGAGARVLLLGMRIPPSLGAEYSTGFAALYARIAQDLDVAFVPDFMARVGGVPELTLSDGLHPTARGHELLAENVAPQLTQLLSR